MAVVDGAGLPISISIADGSRHDVSLVDQALDEAFVEELPPNLIGDKAFDSAPLQQALRQERNIELIAPARGASRPSRRKVDGRRMRRYKRRWKVEGLFAWLKQFRRIVTRWEQKADNYLGFLQLGCMIILLRQM
jgi:transposase